MTICNAEASAIRTGASYLDATIYIFKSLSKPETGKQITLKEGLALIQQSEHEAQIRQARQFGKGSSEYDETKKFQVPCFSWNVSEYAKHYRDKTKIKQFSGLMYLDIDTPGINIETLAELPEFLFAWHSFGGQGIGFIVAVDGLTSENFASTWQSLKARYYEKGFEIDEQAKDPARANVLSHSEVFYNQDLITPFQAVEPIFIPKPKRKEVTGETAPTDQAYLLIKKALDNKGYSFGRGTRNDYVFRLASRSNSAGIEQDLVTDWILDEFQESDFTEDEIRSAIKSAYKDVSAFGNYPFIIEQKLAGNEPENSLYFARKDLHEGIHQKTVLCAQKPVLEPISCLTFRINSYNERNRKSETDFYTKKYVLNPGQYITDLSLDHSITCYLHGGTGTGKSTAEIQAFEERDFYVPTQELARQLGTKENVHFVMAGLKPSESGTQIATYNSLDKMLARDTSTRIQVIDEAHNLQLAQGYRGEIMNALLDASVKYKALRLSSGTPLPTSCHPILKDIPVIQICRESEPVKDWKIVQYDDRTAALLKRLERGKLQTIVLQSRKQSKRLAKLLSAKGYQVQCFNTDTKREENHRSILDNCVVNKGIDVLIVTGLFFEGLNIHNDNIGAVHLLSTVSRYDIQQLFSRFRDQLPECLNIYRSANAEDENLSFDFKTTLAEHLESAQNYVRELNKSEKDPDSNMAKLAKQLVQSMAKQPARIARKVDDSWQVNYLAVDYLTALEESRMMYLMAKLLSEYNFNFTGVEQDQAEDQDLKNEAKVIHLEAKKEEEQEQEAIIKSFAYGGSSYVEQALDSENEEEVRQAKRILKLQEYTGFEQALELLSIPMSDGKYETLLNQVRAQVYLKNRKAYDLENSYVNVIDAIYKTFSVGDALTSKDILKQFKKLRNKHFETQRKSLTENKAVRHLKFYFEVKRTKHPTTRENCYLIMSTNPLKLINHSSKAA
jgi:hypothetical protein